LKEEDSLQTLIKKKHQLKKENMLLNLLYFLSPNALEDRKKKRRY